MKTPYDNFAIAIFDAIATLKGYSFKLARTETEIQQATNIYNEQAITFPEHLLEENESFKIAAINFVAYYKGTPVGMVSLGNPKIKNRTYAHFGVDEKGECFEIQGLVVKKEHRDGSQFVMLGLVKTAYQYSMKNGIHYWIAGSTQSLYLTMRQYCKKIEVIAVDYKKLTNPVALFLAENNYVNTFFIMDLTDFKPWKILKRFIKKRMKKLGAYIYIKEKIALRQNS